MIFELNDAGPLDANVSAPLVPSLPTVVTPVAASVALSSPEVELIEATAELTLRGAVALPIAPLVLRTVTPDELALELIVPMPVMAPPALLTETELVAVTLPSAAFRVIPPAPELVSIVICAAEIAGDMVNAPVDLKVYEVVEFAAVKVIAPAPLLRTFTLPVLVVDRLVAELTSRSSALVLALPVPIAPLTLLRVIVLAEIVPALATESVILPAPAALILTVPLVVLLATTLPPRITLALVPVVVTETEVPAVKLAAVVILPSLELIVRVVFALTASPVPMLIGPAVELIKTVPLELTAAPVLTAPAVELSVIAVEAFTAAPVLTAPPDELKVTEPLVELTVPVVLSAPPLLVTVNAPPALDAPRLKVVAASLSATLTIAVPPVFAVRAAVSTVIGVVVPIAPLPLARVILLAVSELAPVAMAPVPPAIKVMEEVPELPSGLPIVRVPAIAPVVLNVSLLTADIC